MNHPGIVGVHGVGRTPGGGIFLAMELVRGSDLDEVRRAASIDPCKAAAWIAETAGIIDGRINAASSIVILSPATFCWMSAGESVSRTSAWRSKSKMPPAGYSPALPPSWPPNRLTLAGDQFPRGPMFGVSALRCTFCSLVSLPTKARASLTFLRASLPKPCHISRFRDLQSASTAAQRDAAVPCQATQRAVRHRQPGP